MAKAGWLGITMPEEVGGSNLGVLEAALIMQTLTSSDGGPLPATQEGGT